MLRLFFFFKHSCHQTREDVEQFRSKRGSLFVLRATKSCCWLQLFLPFCKVRTWSLNGSDKNLFHFINNVTEVQNTYQFVLRLWTSLYGSTVRLQDLDFRNDIKSPDF
jgi:hypothetical protein